MTRHIPILKTTIQHLKTASKLSDSGQESDDWNIEIKVELNSKTIKEEFTFKTVWIQAVIEQNTADDIFLVNDLTGKAKIVNCKQAISSLDHPSTNNYCNIIGTLTQIRGLPEIRAERIIAPTLNLDGSTEMGNQIQLWKSAWPTEVQDLQMYLLNIINPMI